MELYVGSVIMIVFGTCSGFQLSVESNIAFTLLQNSRHYLNH